MSETNPEDRLLAEQSTNRVDRVIERSRIARPVREEHAVWIVAEHLFRRRRAGHDGDLAAELSQVTRDVQFHAVVDRYDVRSSRVVGD